MRDRAVSLVHLAATRFERFAGSGKSHPPICGCEDAAANAAGEFVVKLRGYMDQGATGVAFELIASLLASHLGIPTPAPAVVDVSAAFAEILAAKDPARAAMARASIGLNFGSREIRGANILPVDFRLPDQMLPAAASLFAFDALIRNPDRRASNPNLFLRGNSLIAFDHEYAFSFVRDFTRDEHPWRLGHEQYLKEHALYRVLKAKPIDLKDFTAQVETIDRHLLATILAPVPPRWNNEYEEPIVRHILVVAAHAHEFEQEVRLWLR